MIFQINKFDRDANLIGRASFDCKSEADAYYHEAQCKAPQLTMWNMDENVCLKAWSIDSRTTRHCVLRTYLGMN